jgi:predicted glutamine amidotransferase
MCRLFGLSAAPRRVTATFWPIDAPDSLAVQSRQPDGVGLGLFETDGTALVHKRPIAAYEDTEFAREAREVSSSTFLAHVRYASTGGVRTESTHPFLQDGRLFAHNGVVTELDRLRDRVGEKQRGPVGELVGGDTDSELVSALITAYARQGGEMGRAIVAAAGWIAANLPVYALNLVVTTPADMWALRYPDTHPCTCWPDRPAVITATGTWNTPAPPARYEYAPATSPTHPRPSSPANRWTKTRTGVCSPPASLCTSPRTNTSPAGSRSTGRRPTS